MKFAQELNGSNNNESTKAGSSERRKRSLKMDRICHQKSSFFTFSSRVNARLRKTVYMASLCQTHFLLVWSNLCVSHWCSKNWYRSGWRNSGLPRLQKNTK